jgi:alpha-ketoglutarate-dependent taurine dioxygenase
MANAFAVEPLKGATFGATVTGLKLAALDDDEFASLYRVWLEYALVIFPGQHLSRSAQTEFAKRFGPLEFDTTPISNVRSDGSVRADDPTDGVIKVLKGNMSWHCDSTYMPVQAKGAVFSAEIVPSRDGETGWADMRAAYDALSPALKDRLAGLSAYHSLHYSQAKVGHSEEDKGGYSGYGFHVKEPPLRPLIKVHPETGRKTLAIGRHAYGIPGMSEQESARLLEELCDFACRPPRIHYHAWTPGDVVVWDNRCLMHRAREWDMREPRVMHHTRLAGDPVTEAASGRPPIAN